MENAKIGTRQLFIMIILFELGSSLLIPPGTMAGRDAWLSVLLGCVIGLGLFYVYQALYQFFPESSPRDYMNELIGRHLSWAVSFFIFSILLISPPAYCGILAKCLSPSPTRTRRF